MKHTSGLSGLGLAMVFAWSLAALTALAAPASVSSMDITLKVEETAGVARVADPCRSGIPLVPGAVKDETKLRLLDAKGGEVPAQFRVINRRPAGDIEWVCVDFLADVPAKGTAVYHLTDSGPAKAVDKPVKVEDAADAITVTTGPLKLVVSKSKFLGLGEVSLDGAVVLKGGALVIKGVDGKVYRSDENLTSALKVTVEESGPLHVVVRIDGAMKCQTKDGKEHTYPSYDEKTNAVTIDGIKIPNKDGSLGFTVRLHLWKDQTWVRAFVTMVNLAGQTNGWTDATFQYGQYFGETAKRPGNFLVDAVNFDLDLNTAGNLKYKIGGGLEGSETHAGDLEASKGSVILYQDSSAGWMWQARTGKVWDELLKKNIPALKDQFREAAKKAGQDPEAAAAKAPPYREYADYGEHVAGDLLCKRDGCSFMGYRLYTGGKELAPSSTSSFADLGKEAAEGLRAPGWIEVDDGKVAVTAGCRWFWQTFPKSLELRAPGKVTLGLWSQCWPRGHVFEGKIHSTHELVFDFHPSGKGLGGASRFGAFTERLIATPDAKHNLASRAYGDFMLPNPEEWPNYEMASLAAVVPALDKTKNPGWASSMQIEREKSDVYGVWKFGDSMKDSWDHFGQYQELDVPYCLMVQYARTGDIRFFRMAEETDRQLLDIGAYGGGYGHQAGDWSHYYTYGPLLYADVAAEPFLFDANKNSYTCAEHRVGHLRSMAIELWSSWSLANTFGDADGTYRKGMDGALAFWKESHDPKTHHQGAFDKGNQEFMLGMAGDAIGRYCEQFPDDKADRQQLTDAMNWWRNRQKDNWPSKVCANGFAYGARFGDPTLLDFAAEHICTDAKFVTSYRTGVSSAKNWSETVASERLIQVFLHDIDKKRHPEKYKDLP